MAHLPPKPKVSQHWSHDSQPFPTNAAPDIDDFLDFSANRRTSHRRSMSDSVAFLDPSPPMDMRTTMMVVDHAGDRFDDDEDQLMMMSILAADVNPSSPSDPYDDDRLLLQPPPPAQLHPKREAADQEAHSSCQLDDATDGVHAPESDKIVDPKRIKRILANRQSAQRSRVRKLQYISELERSVTSLQAEVSVLSPRVAFLDHQRLLLNVDNTVLKQRIAALAQDKVFKDAHQEALKREIERLRQIYYEQNHLKKNNNNMYNNHNSAADTNPHKDNQLVVN